MLPVLVVLMAVKLVHGLLMFEMLVQKGYSTKLVDFIVCLFDCIPVAQCDDQLLL